MQESLFSKAKPIENESYLEIDITDLGIDFNEISKEDLLSHFYHLKEPLSEIILPSDTTENTQTRRYFADNLVCYECGQTGHTNRRCPQRKLAVCVLCAQKGHNKNYCPMRVCNSCYMCGHRSSECKNKDQRRFIICRRCQSGEHTVRDCPAVWREYLITNNAKIDSYYDYNSSSINKACPYCLGTDHFVDDCKKRFKTKFSIFNSNFMSIIKLYKK